jgi:hypothetical protein
MAGTLRVELDGKVHTLSVGAWFQRSRTGDRYLTLSARPLAGQQDNSDIDRAFGK